jgi:hypothetical protein
MQIRPEAILIIVAATASLWMIVDTGLALARAGAQPPEGVVHPVTGSAQRLGHQAAAPGSGSASRGASLTASAPNSKSQSLPSSESKKPCMAAYPAMRVGPPCNFTACPSPEGPFLYFVTGAPQL